MLRNRRVIEMVFASVALLGLSACASQQARQEILKPARVPEMATITNLAVYPVKDAHRRDHPTATQEMEAMLSTIRVSGQPYFKLTAVSELSTIADNARLMQQVMRGFFDQDTVTQLRAKGVQGLVVAAIDENTSDQRITRRDYKNRKLSCTERTVSVSLTPRIVKASDAQFIPVSGYEGKETEVYCEGSIPTGSSTELARKARAKLYAKLASDIAPHIVTESIPLLAEYCLDDPGFIKGKLESKECDPSRPTNVVRDLVSGGAEFANQDRMDRACEKWNEAANQHETGFAITYLLGVCAEIEDQDLARAKRLYMEADQRVNRPSKTINAALARVDRKIAEGNELDKQIAVKNVANRPKPKPDATVKAGQKLLQDAGYSPGTPDGFIGPMTREALRMYQEDYGLDVSGEFDRDTLRVMGI